MSTEDAVYKFVSLVIASIESETYAWQQCEIAALRHYILQSPNAGLYAAAGPWSYMQNFCFDADNCENIDAAENAVMIALGFYGVYRFGKSAEESLCAQAKSSIGYALGLCASKLENKKSLDVWIRYFSEAHRLHKICKSLKELISYLQECKEFIPIDFASLAVDLYELQIRNLAKKAGSRISSEYRHGCLKYSSFNHS